MTRKLTFLILALFALIAGPGWGQSTYTKVTSTSDLTDGQYLIVYETGGVALDGALSSIDVASNTVSVSISNGSIAGNTTIDAAAFTVTHSTDGYSFLGSNNLYIYHSGSKNTLNTSESVQWQTVSFNNGDAVINGGGNYTLRYNSSYGQTRFRYYTSGQQAIQLYKKQSASTHTLTLSATNGSITAMNGSTQITSGDAVAEGAVLDITATADDWYKFSGWSVNEESSTLGSTTESQTTFTMGTADATLTASFEACEITVNSNDENWGIALYDEDSHTISTLAEEGYRISTTEPYTISPDGAATLAVGEDGEYTVSGVKDQDVIITINFEEIPTVTYTVTFDAGTNGTCSTTDLTEAYAGAGITLPEVTPSDGYAFLGWSTEENPTSADAGEAGETYYPTADITLYAVYNSVYTITWIVNGTSLTEGEQTISVVAGEGITTLPATPSDVSEMKFQGWTATQIETSSPTAPTDLFTDAEHAPEITNSTTFYAVFAEESEGEVTWNIANDIAANDVIIIATNKNYTNHDMKTAGTISNNIMSCKASTFNSDKTQITSVADGTLEFTLGGNSTSGWTLQNGTNYLGMSGDKKVALSSTSSTWTISISSGVATVSQNYNNSNYSLQYNYNNGSDRFTGYTSNQVAISLYKKTQSITYSNFCTTIVIKQLTSISLSGEYPTMFWKGETFSHEGMTVTALYDDESTKDVTASATFTGYDMNTAGEQTVTVTYETKSTTYDITVRAIANTQETAYTVAEARALIDANPAGLATTEVYVKGTVSKNDGINNGTITYWLDENAFEVYKGKNIDNEVFTSADEISVGDDVIIYGKIKKYYSTYEFDEGNYLVSHVKASTLSIDNITVEIDGEISPVIETNVVGDYTISYTSDNEEVVSVVDDEMVTTGLGEATITATLTAEGYKNAETTFTIEVIKALTSIEVATEPTVTDYKVGDMFDPTGLVITATYSDETEEDIAYEENEDKFTFEPSLETELTTDITSVTITYADKVSTTQEISVRALYTYDITWMANGIAVTLEPATVVEGGQIGTLPTPEAEYIPEGFEFAGWSISESSTSTIDETYVVNADETLYAVYSRVEGGTSQGSGNYEKVTSNLEDWSGTYLMAATNSTSSYAFNNTTASDWGKFAEVIISDNIIMKTQATESYEITIGETSTPGNYYLQISDGNYLSASAKSKFNTSETQNNNTSFNFISNDDGKIEITSTSNSSRTIQFNYNGGNGGFRFYDDGTQIIPDLYKKSTGTPGVTKYYTRVYDETQTFASLEVAGPSIILSGKVITVTGTMSNEKPANLIIEDGAQLIQNSEGVMATVLKNITGYSDAASRDGYYLVANPTATNENEIDDYDALDGCTTFDLYTFDPTAEREWVNIGSTSQKVTFERSKGYLYANAQDMALHFRGYLLPTNGTTSIDLVYYNEGKEGREFPGFNLIGNPYTCNVYLNKPAYVLNENGDDFESIEAGTPIAPCEGFFVEATGIEQSVTISTAAPVTAPNALSLNVSQNRGNVIDRAIVSFNGNNDLHKFMMNPAHTNISLAKNGEEFAAVSTSSTSGEMPVNFKAAKNGTYTITVNTENVDAEYLHLIDNKTGMDIDLLASTGSASYTFEAKTSDYASRFKLVFGVNNTDSESSDSNFAYMSNGNLVIDNIEGQATLQIVDELGRVISTETVNGSYNKALNLKAGLYIINLNGMTQKIVVK